MKIQLRCHACSREGKTVVPAMAEVDDDGFCDVQAACGHRLLAVVQNAKFELLLDSAALALRDDYYREAVASFVSALEAFWGFYIRVAARKLGASDETIEPLRKQVKQSERRRGAMHLVRLLLVGANYEPGDDKPVPELGRRTRANFRNEVVHEGLFPPREQAIAYGRWVYDTIAAGIDELTDRAPDALQQEIIGRLGRGHTALRLRDGGAQHVSTYGVGSLLPLAKGPRRSFDDAFRFWGDMNVWDLARRHDAYMRQVAEDAEDAPLAVAPPPPPSSGNDGPGDSRAAQTIAATAKRKGQKGNAGARGGGGGGG